MLAIICIVIAFLLAVYGNWKFKINMGVVSVTAAFLIGCFMLDLSPGTLKKMIPLNVVFPVVALSSFFGFSLENGALLKLVKRILQRAGNMAHLYPVFLFFISTFLGVAGLSAGAVVLLVAPIAMHLSDLMGLDPITTSASFLIGGPMGSNYMMSSGGSIIRGLIEETGYPEAIKLSSTCFWDSVVVFTILFFMIYFLRLPEAKKRARETSFCDEANEPFSKQQKWTLGLILGAFLLGTIPYFLALISPNSMIANWTSCADIGFIAMFGILIAILMHLGDFNAIAKKYVPWNVLIMLSGVSILMGVAEESGAIDLLAYAAGNRSPAWLVPAVLVLIAGCMSFFSSAISVVIPTLFPVVPLVAAECGLNEGLLYSCVVMGASLTGMSPFSTGGAIAVGNAPDDATRSKLVYQQLLIAIASLLIGMIYMTIRGMF